VTEAPFGSPHWDIVILHPRALLAPGMSINIADNRFYYTQNGTQTPSTSEISWSSWTVPDGGDRLCSSSQPNEYLAPFTVENTRAELDTPSLSSLTMVVNAHCKLQDFICTYVPTPRIKRYADLMSELVGLIFFVPTGMENIAELMNPAPPLAVPNPTMVSFLPSQPVQQQTHPSGQGSELGIDPPLDSIQEVAALPTGEDQVCAIESPETPDPDDGLTDTEFRLVSGKATDPHLDACERADAAIMMIFGTHRKCMTFALENC